MKEVILTIQTPEGPRQATFAGDHLTIGQSAATDVHVEDTGLSQLQASIHRQDDNVWILDENSTGGSYVNGKLVPGLGMPLKDGDEISFGYYTTISVKIKQTLSRTVDRKKKSLIASPLAIIACLILTVAALIAATAFGPLSLKRTGNDDRARARAGNQRREAKPVNPPTTNDEAKITATAVSSPSGGASEAAGPAAPTGSSDLRPALASQGVKGSGTRKLYINMTEDEQNEFIYSQARNISRMMSNREYVFTDDVLPYIKKYVDVYARRVGNKSTAIWGEDLVSLFSRARRVAPDIIREFNARGAPKVVGLYIPMIESEYRDCLTSPVGAKGLFQFMAATARGYGVDPDDRCDVKRMAPAAAKYIRDRIAEFGSDAMSVALGIAGYNRSPDSVRRDLNDVINSKNKERSFWTLVANSDKLDRFFQNENIKYVPKFFAAAIVGENPWAFGLQMNPLSSYTGAATGQEG